MQTRPTRCGVQPHTPCCTRCSLNASARRHSVWVRVLTRAVKHGRSSSRDRRVFVCLCRWPRCMCRCTVMKMAKRGPSATSSASHRESRRVLLYRCTPGNAAAALPVAAGATSPTPHRQKQQPRFGWCSRACELVCLGSCRPWHTAASAWQHLVYMHLLSEMPAAAAAVVGMCARALVRLWVCD